MIFSRKIHQKIHFYLLVVVALVMSWLNKPAVSSIGFILLGSHWLLSGRWRQKWQMGKKNTFLWLIVSLYALNVLSFFWSENKEYALDELKLRLNMLSAMVILTLTELTFKQIKIILLTFVASITLGTFWNLGYALYENYKQNHLDTIIKEFYIYHDLDHFVRHGGYLSAYLTIAIFILLFLLEIDIHLKKYYLLIWILATYLSLHIFLLSFQMGLITFVASSSFWAIYYAYKRKRKSILIVFAGVIVIVFSVLFLKNDIIHNKVTESISLVHKSLNGDSLYHKKTKDLNKEDLLGGTTLRYIIWNLTLKDAPNYYGIGVGIGDTGKEMLRIYKKNTFYFGYRDYEDRSPFNCHNQFLESFFSTGILGLLLYIGIFIAAFRRSLKQNNKLLWVCSFVLLMLSLVESILAKQAGVQAIGFLWSIIYLLDTSMIKQGKLSS
jgi:hypothetical protein